MAIVLLGLLLTPGCLSDEHDLIETYDVPQELEDTVTMIMASSWENATGREFIDVLGTTTPMPNWLNETVRDSMATLVEEADRPRASTGGEPLGTGTPITIHWAVMALAGQFDLSTEEEYVEDWDRTLETLVDRNSDLELDLAQTSSDQNDGFVSIIVEDEWITQELESFAWQGDGVLVAIEWDYDERTMEGIEFNRHQWVILEDGVATVFIWGWGKTDRGSGGPSFYDDRVEF